MAVRFQLQTPAILNSGKFVPVSTDFALLALCVGSQHSSSLRNDRQIFYGSAHPEFFTWGERADPEAIYIYIHTYIYMFYIYSLCLILKIMS
jgi:hypothetical protein